MPSVKLKKRKEITVAYIEYVGSYDKIPFDTIMKKLYGWAKDKKVRPGFKPLTIYPDDPATTSAVNLRSWVGIPIYGNAPEDADIKTTVLCESLIVRLRHAGPASEYSNSYKAIIEWTKAEGYEITGPPAEYYPKKPKVKNGQTIIYADIEFPVKKL
ncbi:MAG: GyrI-like domain-containing protein [Thermoplasmata archaeon]|nr:GyrI-like domain-containing protein [Thermoplasmata archaeon]